jgi:hypothetical protein
VVFLAILGPAKKSSPRGALKDFTNTLACSSRAFEVVPGTNLVCHGHTLERGHDGPEKSVKKKIRTYLLRGYRSLTRPLELLKHSSVTSEIVLAANEDDRETGAEVHHFRNPLISGDAVRRPNVALLHC